MEAFPSGTMTRFISICLWSCVPHQSATHLALVCTHTPQRMCGSRGRGGNQRHARPCAHTKYNPGRVCQKQRFISFPYFVCSKLEPVQKAAAAAGAAGAGAGAEAALAPWGPRRHTQTLSPVCWLQWFKRH